ncbi:zf-HC2 domain-containing protein [Ornithinibacillus halophilus]|uniref:Anti-sigma-W factor RsiW n=1 Tax=Ornithinibacillus halophilus TaxID=930117 RepID=A0A1M5E206_9BACI|nr:zf-HC2 domain-containing protein [Ornithinibacillus halophilus]SHF73102.1 Transmembrane transcriptional regulator (anti-sigma factor RsiW) [Ornithinibacillus halophilus]
MDCNKETVELMHKYLDGELTKDEEIMLREHLEDCEECQKHFHELKRTITLIKSTDTIHAPNHFSTSVMKNLPAERKGTKYVRWLKMHPIMTAAAIFFVLMSGSMFTAWQQDSQLTVSKQDDLIIRGDTVIVPEDVIVEGDLVVKNGNLRVDGKIEGDVTLINGKMIEEYEIEGEGLMASVGEVNGEFKQVDRAFEWIWYHIQNLFKNIFSFGD